MVSTFPGSWEVHPHILTLCSTRQLDRTASLSCSMCHWGKVCSSDNLVRLKYVTAHSLTTNGKLFLSRERYTRVCVHYVPRSSLYVQVMGRKFFLSRQSKSKQGVNARGQCDSKVYQHKVCASPAHSQRTTACALTNCCHPRRCPRFRRPPCRHRPRHRHHHRTRPGIVRFCLRHADLATSRRLSHGASAATWRSNRAVCRP